MIKHWIIKNHHDEFLIGFFANGKARWRSSDGLRFHDQRVIYSTNDLARVAIPALADAGVDVFTLERYT